MQDVWPTTVSAFDLTQKWNPPGDVVFLILFFWAVGAVFIVRERWKKGRRSK